jgi:membrane-associated HD superfamily phosphohydrolase
LYCSSLDVKTIVQKWYKELAQDAKDYERQAHKVNIWDRQLRENQKILESVVDNVHKIMISQSDLKSACESVEAFQQNLEADLENLSENLDRELENLQLQEPTEDDYEREKTCTLVETLDQSLSQVKKSLSFYFVTFFLHVIMFVDGRNTQESCYRLQYFRGNHYQCNFSGWKSFRSFLEYTHGTHCEDCFGLESSS